MNWYKEALKQVSEFEYFLQNREKLPPDAIDYIFQCGSIDAIKIALNDKIKEEL